MQTVQQRLHDLCTPGEARLSSIVQQPLLDTRTSTLPPSNEYLYEHTANRDRAHGLRNSMRDDPTSPIRTAGKTIKNEENKPAKNGKAGSAKTASVVAERTEAEQRIEESTATFPDGRKLRDRAASARANDSSATAASPALDLGPEWLHPVLYPRVPPTAATVHFQELSRLEEGQWLNDSLIEFSFRYIQGSQPQLRKDVYIFNTYFYASLTGNTGKLNKNAINYDAVRRWTSKIKLFEYNYVVVPINKNMHWYLAIICNLRNVRKTLGLDDDEAHSNIFPPVHVSGGISASTEKENTMDTSTEHMSHLSLQSSPDPGGPIDDVGGKRKLWPGSRLQSHDVAIITLDSLENKHPNIVNNLNQYLAAEAQDKLGATIGKLPGVTAKGIPTQDNAYDCGLYAIEYIYYFMQDPEGFVGKILRREWTIKPDWQNFKPSQMRRKVLDVLKNEYKEQANIRNRDRVGKRAARQHAVNKQTNRETDKPISTTDTIPPTIQTSMENHSTKPATARDVGTQQILPSQMMSSDMSRTKAKAEARDGGAEVSQSSLLITPAMRTTTTNLVDEAQEGDRQDHGLETKPRGAATFAELDDALRPEAAAALKPPAPPDRLGLLESFEFSEGNASSSPLRSP